jgi:hypothetical protein
VLPAARQQSGGRLLGVLAVGEQQLAGRRDHRGKIGHRTGRCPRIDPRHEQHLALVEVAYAGERPLIEQRLAHGASGIGAQPAQRLVQIPVAAEQVWA